jgi:hypothetical protein
MSHTEAPISINLKTAAGTQLTLRANTPDEFTALTTQVFAIVEAIDEVEKAVRSTGFSAPATTPTNPAVGYLANELGGTVVSESWNTPAPAQPFAGSPAAASGGQRMCPHGTMTRIYGMSGKFGPYKGHFCPAQKGDPSKCATQYVKAGSPEFATFTPDQTKA